MGGDEGYAQIFQRRVRQYDEDEIGGRDRERHPQNQRRDRDQENANRRLPPEKATSK